MKKRRVSRKIRARLPTDDIFTQVVRKLLVGVNSLEFEKKYGGQTYISPGITAMSFIRTLRITGELEEKDGMFKYLQPSVC